MYTHFIEFHNQLFLSVVRSLKVYETYERFKRQLFVYIFGLLFHLKKPPIHNN